MNQRAYCDFLQNTLHVPLLKKIGFLFIFYALLHIAKEAQTVLPPWMAVSKPSFLPLHGFLYVLLPQISSFIICPAQIHYNMAAFLLEISTYCALLQMPVLHAAYTLCSHKLAWVMALHFGMHYVHLIQVFLETFPRSTLSLANLHVSLYSYLFGTILLSFLLFAKDLPVFSLEFHFESWLAAEAAAYVNMLIWRESSYISFRL